MKCEKNGWQWIYVVGEAIQKDVEGEGRGVGGGRKECRWRKEER